MRSYNMAATCWILRFVNENRNLLY